MRRLLVALMLGLVWLGAPQPIAQAETAGTMQVQVTNYLVALERAAVGDEEGHILGLGQRTGEAVFSNQETASYTNAFTFDAHRGRKVPSEGYTKFTFADASWFSLFWQAETSLGPDGLAHTKGQGNITQGAGRFAGMKGTATFNGKEQSPAGQDPKRTTMLEATIAYTLP